ncbi:hypothetical protein [Cyclobacterium xiamenense]|uniref:hypothetical protein n=1 Tax=Cyclobacterium xiamenense TaxID=1297121 RepID=UPI00116005FB|nr:hypothetical protein [Cyclobacterium xiamenense]
MGFQIMSLPSEKKASWPKLNPCRKGGKPTVGVSKPEGPGYPKTLAALPGLPFFGKGCGGIYPKNNSTSVK